MAEESVKSERRIRVIVDAMRISRENDEDDCDGRKRTTWEEEGDC